MKPPKTAKELFSSSKAELFSSSLVNNSLVISQLQDSTGKTFTLEDCVVELAKQNQAIKDGNTDQSEEILFYQAKTLDTLFCSLVKRSTLNMGEYFDAADKYMRLALRAQSQCRATLETLAEIKKPRQPLIQNNIQANSTQYQQVQNGSEPPAMHAPARGENLKSGNKLMDNDIYDEAKSPELTHQKTERLGLDIGTPRAPSEANSAMATVEQQHWTEDR